MSYVIGIDLGTSSLKGLVVDKKGKVLDQETRNYPLSHPKTGHSEQNPQYWVEALEEVLKELISRNEKLKQELEGISFSGQMHSLVLLGEDDRPLRDAILWNDVRTTEECRIISEKLGTSLIEKTKNIALEGFTLPKILWVQEHEPDIWAKTKILMLPKDYLGFYLTGQTTCEYSDASGTLMLNLENKEWDQDILDMFAIEKEKLPKLCESTEEIGLIKTEILDILGIARDIKVFSGGADNACGALATGIVDETRGMSSIGTSGVFLSYEGNKVSDYKGKLHYFNHVLPDIYYSMGVTLAAGQSLTWFKDIFCTGLSFDAITEMASKSNIGSNGLLFSPFIMGERTPYVDANIRASFIGMSASHELKDFSRAVIEGITMSLKESQLIMEQTTSRHFKEIISVGGGAKSDFWMQVQADIFNAKMRTLKVEQGPGFGAAMIAALGLNWYSSPKECVDTFVSYEKEFYPIQENVQRYEELFKLYKKIYQSTQELSHELINFQET